MIRVRSSILANETLGGIFIKLQPHQAGCKTGTGPGACPCVDVEQPHQAGCKTGTGPGACSCVDVEQPHQAGCKTGASPGACSCVDVEPTPALLITGMVSLRYRFENRCKLGTGVRVKQSGA